MPNRVEGALQQVESTESPPQFFRIHVAQAKEVEHAVHTDAENVIERACDLLTLGKVLQGRSIRRLAERAALPSPETA